MTTTRFRKAQHGTYAKGCTVAYLRVSTAEQADSRAGLDAQRASIEAYAAMHELTVDHWYVDAGVSGSKRLTDRPEAAAALTALAACRAGGVMLVSKLDRIARSAPELLNLRERVEREGWTLSAADGSIDLATRDGRFMFTVKAGVAEVELDMIRERTREGMEAKRQQGVRLGRPVTLPQAVRERIATERDNGATFAAIAAGLNADGIPTARGGSWYPSTIKAVCDSLAHDAYAAERSAQS